MKTENRQQLLVVLAIAFVAVFAGDKLLFTPLGHLWTAREQEIGKLRRQVADGSALIRREDTLRSHWDQMQTNTLPTSQSLSQEQVLKAVENWSQESGVSLNGTTPQWKQDTDEYKTLVCKVDASGTLWALSRFLYDIEKGPMALKVDSVYLSSKDNAGQVMSLGLQISGLVLTPKAK
jgi:Tfp pilus assembly protein PilO